MRWQGDPNESKGKWTNRTFENGKIKNSQVSAKKRRGEERSKRERSRRKKVSLSLEIAVTIAIGEKLHGVIP